MPADDDILDSPLNAEEQARAKFLEDTAELMKTPLFRRWVWHVIENVGWCAAFYCDDEPQEASKEWFAKGKRWLGLTMQRLIMAVGGESYKQMLLEAMNLKLQRELKELHDKRKSGAT